MPVTETISSLNRPNSIAVMPEAGASPSDIAALTARMVHSDEMAWREFYDGYFNRLLRYLLVVTNGREEAAREALQLTLMRVVRNIRKFDSEAAFWSWLTVLARSSIVDDARKRNRYLALLERFFQNEPVATDASESDANAHLLQVLEQRVANLPPDERDLIEQKYFEDGSVKELADELETTEKAVESRMVRIRRKLRDAILAQLETER
jgi:RNA polymerase sigma-70 factor (ECF subfamily)